MASIKGYELKNVKTFQGLEWTGVQGSIYYKGKKVGWYNDSGNGGMADIELRLPGETGNDRQKERENQLESAVKKYYAEHPLQGEYAQLTPDAELFLSNEQTTRGCRLRCVICSGRPVRFARRAPRTASFVRELRLLLFLLSGSGVSAGSCSEGIWSMR